MPNVQKITKMSKMTINTKINIWVTLTRFGAAWHWDLADNLPLILATVTNKSGFFFTTQLGVANYCLFARARGY